MRSETWKLFKNIKNYMGWWQEHLRVCSSVFPPLVFPFDPTAPSKQQCCLFAPKKSLSLCSSSSKSTLFPFFVFFLLLFPLFLLLGGIFAFPGNPNPSGCQKQDGDRRGGEYGWSIKHMGLCKVTPALMGKFPFVHLWSRDNIWDSAVLSPMGKKPSRSQGHAHS